MDAIKKQIWEDAERFTKVRCMLDKIIQEKEFPISEEELDRGIEFFATSIGMETENARENLGPLVNNVVFELKAEKAAQYLVEQAIIMVKASESQGVNPLLN